MNTILATLLLIVPAHSNLQAPSSQSVANFKQSFAARKRDRPTGSPDPAIQRCMAIMAEEVRKRLVAQAADEFAIGEFLLPFMKATGQASYPSTDYRIMDVSLADRDGMKAVSVTMGAVSRLFVWRKGKAVAMPRALSWLFGYEAHPYFADCGAMALNCRTVQDAGMRFGTRSMSVTFDAKGAKITGEVKGEWLLEEEDAPSPFVIEGDRLTLKSLDRPNAFYVSSSTKLFERSEVYTISQQGLKRTSANLSMPYLRAADAWMEAALRAKKRSKMQQSFVRVFGRQPLIADEFSEQADASGRTATLLTEVGQFTFFFKKGVSPIEVQGFKFEPGK